MVARLATARRRSHHPARALGMPTTAPMIVSVMSAPMIIKASPISLWNLGVPSSVALADASTSRSREPVAFRTPVTVCLSSNTNGFPVYICRPSAAKAGGEPTAFVP